MRKKVYWVRPAVNNHEVSIVTNPIPVGADKYTEAVKNTVKKMRDLTRSAAGKLPLYLDQMYKGHPAVTRSVVEGLRRLGTAHNYNPSTLNELSRNVVVLSGIAALKQMIQLKQQGYIRRLVVGPNMFLDPATYKELFSSPEIDLYITHAPVCALIERSIPALKLRCVPWAAGVDCEFWKPLSVQPKKKILIYNKQSKGPTDDPQKYIDELTRRGLDVTVINYGSYTPGQYRDLLHQSALMIGFTRDETQGIAWSEAWAADVPTFFWKNSEPTYLGVKYDGNAAPYLCDRTGLFFSGIEEFIGLIDKWQTNAYQFTPRQWCIQHMSDEVCAEELLKILYSI